MSACESAVGVALGPGHRRGIDKTRAQDARAPLGEAYPNTTSENNALVVTARNPVRRWDPYRRLAQSRSIILVSVIKDDEYEMEQHYGHSGITMWKENMKWSAWRRITLRRAEAEKRQRVSLNAFDADLSGGTRCHLKFAFHLNAVHISKVQDVNVQAKGRGL